MAETGCEGGFLCTRLPPSPASVSAARRFTADAVDRLGAGCAAECAQLLVSELATNVVVHASTPMRLSVHKPDHKVRVEVRDDDPHPPRDADGDPLAPGGRGLLLVEALAQAWGVNRNERGKTVWFELPAE
jgi:anti-sigma regulatory factor (Ser/Thr protein kinase)